MPAELAGTPPSEVWARKAGRGFTGPLGAAGAVVYGGGYDRRVFAVDADSGEVLWAARLGGPIIGGVLVGDSMVFAATARPDGELYAIRRSDGRVRWSTRTGETIVPLAAVGDLVITHTLGGQVVAVQGATGDVRWRARVRPGRAAPVVEGGAIIATGIDSLYRLDAATGDVLLRRAIPGSVIGGWVVDRGRLVAGTADSTVVALDPKTLDVIWSQRVDAPVLDAPLVQGDTLVAVSRAGTIYRIVGGGSGGVERVIELQWPVTAPPVGFGDVLVLGGADGTLRAFERDGRERWRMAVWRPIDVAPLALDDALIAVGGNGDIYRLEP